MDDVEAFWEQLYTTRAGGDRIWSGRANAELVRAVVDLPPGRALDLGCGEGGDTVHLARLGWQVTAVDVSPTALARTRAAAEQAGVSDRVDTEQHDLADWTPAAAYDLVVAMFFQSPLELPRERVIHRAAEALTVGGRLVVVEHGALPTWAEHQHDHGVDFPTPEELLASLDLDPERFTPVEVTSRSREATGPDGQHDVLVDTVVVVRRAG